MAGVAWQVDDGARHNFSPASLSHAPGLYIAAAPGGDVPGWGMGDADIGLRMMSLTSWLDLLCRVKIRHVVCIMNSEELQKRFSDIGDGDLGKTCRGQGLTFHHTPVASEGSIITPAVLASAIAQMRALPAFGKESTVVVCSDGRIASAAVAAAWLVLQCGQEPAKAISALNDDAKKVGASRAAFDAFSSPGSEPAEVFADMLSAADKLLS
ncbi:unnamed protein product [Polarella glacialis]|uniref:Tyrosine specific protein phosphatases domain-containing protein n=1 Tax=Polarella glacialis TaxID=89957 RepID=A0A813GEW3_POLGL|nr:unnamed protein product [Polarella glacialis]